MANANAPFGFRPVRHVTGAPYNGQTKRYAVPSSDSTALGIGSPVTLAADGDATGIPYVKHLTAGDPTSTAANRFLGSVVSVEPDTQESLVYRAASTARYVNVADSPDLIFEVQYAGTLAAGDFNMNSNASASSGVDTGTGYSTVTLSATLAATSDKQFHIEGIRRTPDNEIGQYAVLEVTPVFHVRAVNAVIGVS